MQQAEIVHVADQGLAVEFRTGHRLRLGLQDVGVEGRADERASASAASMSGSVQRCGADGATMNRRRPERSWKREAASLQKAR